MSTATGMNGRIWGVHRVWIFFYSSADVRPYHGTVQKCSFLRVIMGSFSNIVGTRRDTYGVAKSDA